MCTCKCIIHENYINKLKALSIVYDSTSFWDTVLCNNTTHLQCWQGNIDPGKDVFFKEWKYIDQNRCVGQTFREFNE